MEEMIDTSGFYKRDGEQLLYGPNFVLNADYELRRETREQNALPVDGWQWFDTAAEAYAAHGLSMPESEAENKVQNTGLGSAALPRSRTTPGWICMTRPSSWLISAICISM